MLNLLILLLVSRSFVTKDRIRDVIDDYRRGSDEAFEKMFERDKDELRSLGIPIEVGHLDAFFEDEVGYRIKRDAFELPQVELEPDEAAVVGLAARVWQHAGLADATSQALLKLKAAGLPVDREALDVVQPRLVADEPAFDAVWAATQSRTPVTFDYRRRGLGEPTRRGGDEDDSVRLHGSISRRPAKVGERDHPAHRVAHEGQRAGHVEGCKDVGKVGGELLDDVGAGRGGIRIAVAAVVIADDPDTSTPPPGQVMDLAGPRSLLKAEAVQEHDGGFGIDGPSVSHRQSHAIANGHCPFGVGRACGGHDRNTH